MTQVKNISRQPRRSFKLIQVKFQKCRRIIVELVFGTPLIDCLSDLYDPGGLLEVTDARREAAGRPRPRPVQEVRPSHDEHQERGSGLVLILLMRLQ